MPQGRKADKSGKAAVMYLDEGIDMASLRERFGIGRSVIWAAVCRLRKERELQASAT